MNAVVRVAVVLLLMFAGVAPATAAGYEMTDEEMNAFALGPHWREMYQKLGMPVPGAPTAQAAQAPSTERILLFVSNVVVERSGELSVTETIWVKAEGRDINRGILRDFPTRYVGRQGAHVEVSFDVQDVMRDGSPEQWSQEQLANGVRLRIGSPYRQLTPGQHEYVIRYRTNRQVGFFKDYDELYWNATGNGWTLPIDQVDASITLPQAVPFRQSAFYTGPQGAQESNATIVEERPGYIVFRTSQALPPKNGLTVAAAWQKGVVEQPSLIQGASWWLRDNPAVAASVVGLLLVLAFYGVAWWLVGRDPPRGTIIPLFEPPAGMSAAAVRFVYHGSYDERCFSAAILDLGVSKHLRINGSGSDTVLERCNSDRPLPPDERDMKSQLFVTKPSVVLDQTNWEPLVRARSALANRLEEAYDGLLPSKNYGWSVVGVMLSAAAVGTIATYSDDFPLSFWVVWLTFILLVAVFGRAALVLGSVTIGLLVAAPQARGFVDLIPVAASFILAAVAGRAFRWLEAPTNAGRKVMDQIEGLRLYLGVAEEDRLKAFNPPEKTPELFERFLPYAVALDFENAWANRFTATLMAAGSKATIGSWYTGNESWTNNPVTFADHLGGDFSRTFESTVTAAYASSVSESISAGDKPPGTSDSFFGSSSGSFGDWSSSSSSSSDSSDSGSSGGGSSGDGGGGGGGSGW